VLNLVAQGLANQEIAEVLNVSERTGAHPCEQHLEQVAPGKPHPGGALCASRRAGKTRYRLEAARSFVIHLRHLTQKKAAWKRPFVLCGIRYCADSGQRRKVIG